MGISILNKNKKLVLLSFIFSLTFFNACVVNKNSETEKTEKAGSQLWAENCARCHNLPTPVVYDDDKWETVSMHMKIRANMSNNDIKIIREFLQLANGD